MIHPAASSLDANRRRARFGQLCHGVPWSAVCPQSAAGPLGPGGPGPLSPNPVHTVPHPALRPACWRTRQLVRVRRRRGYMPAAARVRARPRSSDGLGETRRMERSSPAGARDRPCPAARAVSPSRGRPAGPARRPVACRGPTYGKRSLSLRWLASLPRTPRLRRPLHPCRKISRRFGPEPLRCQCEGIEVLRAIQLRWPSRARCPPAGRPAGRPAGFARSADRVLGQPFSVEEMLGSCTTTAVRRAAHRIGRRLDAPRHAGDAPRHDGDAPPHAGDAPRHAGDAPRHAADAPRHAGDAPRHAADAPRHAGDAPRHAGDAPPPPRLRRTRGLSADAPLISCASRLGRARRADIRVAIRVAPRKSPASGPPSRHPSRASEEPGERPRWGATKGGRSVASVRPGPARPGQGGGGLESLEGRRVCDGGAHPARAVASAGMLETLRGSADRGKRPSGWAGGAGGGGVGEWRMAGALSLRLGGAFQSRERQLGRDLPG